MNTVKVKTTVEVWNGSAIVDYVDTNILQSAWDNMSDAERNCILDDLAIDARNDVVEVSACVISQSEYDND